MRTSTPQAVECRAPAKVNLTLAVLGRLPNGFHRIESWVVMVRWYDRLTFAPADGLSLTIAGSCSSVPEERSNLVWRAAEALAKTAGQEPTARIGLEKRIPVGAGLGGGSSDAAATLLGLNTLWELNWPVERLMPVAAKLGSDVPLFLESGSVVIRGRGEQVARLARGWRSWLALVVPSYPVSTAAVYGRWAPGETKRPTGTPPWSDLRAGSLELSSRLFNDLEPAAFVVEPRLAKLHAALDGLDGRSVRMTGSGGCLFALFDDEPQAQAWSQRASELLGEGDRTCVVETV